MSLLDLSIQLDSLLNEAQVVFLNIDPIDDFTVPYQGNIFLLTSHGELKISLKDVNRGSHLTVFSMIFRLLSKIKVLLTWEIKELISYLRYQYPEVKFILPVNSVDLKYGQAFLGAQSVKPQSFKDALSLASRFIKNDNWCQIQREIYLPLSLEILPKIETRGQKDIRSDVVLFSKYVIEGQANGRLKCYAPTGRYFNPHILSGEDKESLRPVNTKNVFVAFDYKGMEVFVLAWLSRDEQLLELVNHKDIYSAIYELIFEKQCDLAGRKMIKSVFLPMIFGLQPPAMSERLNMGLEEATELSSRFQDKFPRAFAWVQSKEAEVDCEEFHAKDFFGRGRVFSNVLAYKRRNSEIQGPASRICLKKLVDVCGVFRDNFAFHVHDGYYFECAIKELKDFIRSAVDLFESPIQDGLRLSISCSVGNKLSQLKDYPIQRS